MLIGAISALSRILHSHQHNDSGLEKVKKKEKKRKIQKRICVLDPKHQG